MENYQYSLTSRISGLIVHGDNEYNEVVDSLLPFLDNVADMPDRLALSHVDNCVHGEIAKFSGSDGLSARQADAFDDINSVISGFYDQL